MTYDRLSSPATIGPCTIPNRLVMPPMVIWKSGSEALVTNSHITHYAESAGPGLVIVEATAVSPEGRLAASQIGAFSDSQVPGLSRLAQAIAENGAVPGIQIHHAGAKTNKKENYGLPIFAPAVLPQSPEGTCELSDAEIRRIIDDFAAAAKRVARSGFRLIELHGAHGYLGSQFLSPRANRRTDKWGGSIQNRARFLLEALAGVRSSVGAEVAVTVRLGVAESEGGLSVEEGTAVARMLQDAGADAVHVSHAGSMPTHIVPHGSRWAATMELARLTKRALQVPVIGVGDIRRPEEADLAIEHGFADLVAVGRAMLADPQWARKALSGNESRIVSCASCKPRCWHFSDSEKCPARKIRLRQNAEAS